MPQQLTQPRILVIEDERSIASAVAARLRSEGYLVDIAADGPSGLEAFTRGRPDLVVLDLMLPGLDGIEVCRRMQADRSVPVLMLTALDSEADLITGLEVGADDYMTKPFSARELVARVHAILRRVAASAAAAEVPTHRRRRARSRDAGCTPREAVHLTPTEFDLLMYLASRPGRVSTREELLEQCGGTKSPRRAPSIRTSVPSAASCADLIRTARSRLRRRRRGRS